MGDVIAFPPPRPKETLSDVLRKMVGLAGEGVSLSDMQKMEALRAKAIEVTQRLVLLRDARLKAADELAEAAGLFIDHGGPEQYSLMKHAREAYRAALKAEDDFRKEHGR